MASTLPPAPRAGADDAPAVSVIIPTVDREKLLLRAIRHLGSANGREICVDQILSLIHI